MPKQAPYLSLSKRLRQLPEKVSPAALLRTVQGWLQDEEANIGSRLRDRFDLGWYSTVPLEEYPVSRSSLNADEEVRRLLEVPPDSMETLVMRLRDVLWEGLTLESGLQCPRCDESELRLLWDDGARGIVLACDLCTWVQDPSGREWKAGTKLTAPTSLQLEGKG